ncbi:unnamed protein product [Lactuca virosa]|nr:unnamed protein product [Lactuca virosa]
MAGFLGTERQFQATYGKPLAAARDSKCSAKDAEAGVHAMEALHKQKYNGSTSGRQLCWLEALHGLPGLPEGLEKEVHDLLPPSISNGIRVITSPYGADSAWYGAKLLSN